MSRILFPISSSSSFFFNTTSTTEIYTLSLHDALPICKRCTDATSLDVENGSPATTCPIEPREAKVVVKIHMHTLDRKSTRLNSSHTVISYAVFCLKKKKKEKMICLHKHYKEQQ